jgi:hypothetical protein
VGVVFKAFQLENVSGYVDDGEMCTDEALTFPGDTNNKFVVSARRQAVDRNLGINLT